MNDARFYALAAHAAYIEACLELRTAVPNAADVADAARSAANDAARAREAVKSTDDARWADDAEWWASEVMRKAQSKPFIWG